MQEAGTFIITFPSTYTASFNTGFNVIESVCAAPPIWWQWAELAAARLRALRRVPVSQQDFFKSIYMLYMSDPDIYSMNSTAIANSAVPCAVNAVLQVALKHALN